MKVKPLQSLPSKILRVTLPGKTIFSFYLGGFPKKQTLKGQPSQTVQAQLWRRRLPGPPLEFPGEHGILTDIYAQVREEEQLISLQFLGGQQDVSTCRMKKRKQVDDTAGIT